jgi:hypothetical protein
MKLLWTATALTAFAANAYAAPALENMTGAELQSECRKADPGFCRGYIQAVSEGLMTRGITMCIDTETTSRDDLMAKVVPWIAHYSGDLNDLGVYQTLVALYPCEDESAE